LSLRTTGSQTEADTYCPAPSPHTADPMSRIEGPPQSLASTVENQSTSEEGGPIMVYWKRPSKAYHAAIF
jgi:hypothetical protein